MKPPPPASAFGGSVGKNAELKEEPVVLQLLMLLLELLREAGSWAGRSAGEQRLDECARLHAERERIKRFAAHAIDEGDAFPRAKKWAGTPA